MPKVGPTGERIYPPMNETDEGALNMAIGAVDGKVVLNFGTPISWIGMTPEDARDLGKALAKIADSAETQVV
jgi:hypothetical protein